MMDDDGWWDETAPLLLGPLLRLHPVGLLLLQVAPKASLKPEPETIASSGTNNDTISLY